MEFKYICEGEGLEVVLLHGWGSQKEVFRYIIDSLKSSFKVYAIDLPGFGECSEPDKPYVLDDYVDYLESFIDYLQIENPIILGHSFGGRLAIKYSLKNEINKMILVDSAGIKAKRTFMYYVKIYLYKTIRRILTFLRLKKLLNSIRSAFGSEDYNNASIVMKRTLINIVEENLEPILDKIEVETLLLWGSDDMDTPVSDAYKMNKLIKNSGLVEIKNAGHYVFLDQKDYFTIVLNNYLRGDIID